MLRVKVDVIPFGVNSGLDEDANNVVTLYIGNDGTSERRDYGSYDVYTENPVGRPKPRCDRPGWIGRIEHLHRRGADRNRPELAEEALNLYRHVQRRGKP
jgi:hypothetical protein